MNLKGSTLVFSLIILSFLLVSALSVAVVAAVARKSALTSDKSNVSFQIADSAAEAILQKIYKVHDQTTNKYPTLSLLAASITGASCNGSTLSGNVGTGKLYTATLYRNAGSVAAPDYQPILCSDDNTDGDGGWRTKVVKMKLVSAYRQTSRAIEVGVKPYDATLVGHWKLDETTGTTVADTSGNNHPGTLTNGPTSTTGRVGNAYTFDGSGVANDYVNVPAGSGINGLTAYSVSAWIKPTSLGEGSNGRIADKLQASVTNGWRFSVSATNLIQLVQQFSGSQARWSSASSSISTSSGAWQHVVVTYDNTSASNQPIFYVNGSVSATTQNVAPIGSAGTSDSSNALTLGGNVATDSTFAGSIDEVRIYNRVLSPSEVTTLYTNPL